MHKWQDEVRTLVLAGLGVRESARKLGLPEDRVRKFVQRAKLCQQRSKAVATIRELSPIVATAAQVLVDTTASDSKETRIAYIRRARITALAALDRAEHDAEKALQESPLLLADAKLLQAANAPGFERQHSVEGKFTHLHAHAMLRPDPDEPRSIT